MQNDFSKGKVSKIILIQTIPLLLAQLVQLLYNVIDRVYIGHLPDIGPMALTGIGIVFPLTTLIGAFTQLYASGATPLFSIARGQKDEEKAHWILGQTVFLITSTSIILMILCFIFKKSILFAFGASTSSYYYANQYLNIYLLGTFFSMFATALNGMINAQGYPKMGMITICIGAILNIILDPIFIFGLHMGIQGAAIATVIGQFVSFLWVIQFFLKKSQYTIQKQYCLPQIKFIGNILSLGLSGFIVMATNCGVQIICNKTLNIYGGDLYLGIMTIINSVREILSVPVQALGSGCQPVNGYNYGAKQYQRVKEGIRFNVFFGIIYTFAAWLFVIFFPKVLMSLFTSDIQIIKEGTHCLNIYFIGFCFMAFQFCGQSTFQALGCAKRAIFFSLLRKAIIVIPLTIYLPTIMGIEGVFWAEPISNVIGGLACFITMYFSLYRKLPNEKGA
ncbi:MATE family efflux transporter [Floccifex sp.]|uniref:MATE family efflux transporter n=1 Tax=Floccifex sp. TaxID=2815810 RepID=UPI003F01775C